ncbi:hypothetical protein EV179_004096 [Coemansia sp. RSA 487]|nr:hypothetical protein EV179_004096 [Coemansia sp. RSA 487]
MHSSNFSTGTAGYSSQQYDSDHQRQHQKKQQQQQHPPPHHSQMVSRPGIHPPNSQQHQQQYQSVHSIHEVSAGLNPHQHSTASHSSAAYQTTAGQYIDSSSSYMFGAGPVINSTEIGSAASSMEIANNSDPSAVGDPSRVQQRSSAQHFSSPSPSSPAFGQLAKNSSIYPSTLMPSRHIHAHPYQQSTPHTPTIPQQHQHQQHRQLHQQHQQHQQQPPVKLLQSCDSCRRRKIRCSGEKPVCSSCMRYQEICHYSPLATPRRRAGKRARTTKDSDIAASISQPAFGIVANESMDRASSGELLVSSSSVRAPSGSSAVTTNGEHAVSDNTKAAGPSAQATTSIGNSEDRHWQTEATELRSNINSLAQKFDSISGKLDSLIRMVGKRRRDSTDDSNAGYGSGEDTPGYESDNHHKADGTAVGRGDLGTICHDFNNLIDKTSRFNIDSTNVGNISGMIRDIDKQRAGQQNPSGGVHVSVSIHSPQQTNGDGNGGDGMVNESTLPGKSHIASAMQQLDTPEMRDHLIDKFYLNTDINTISFIPRYIFHKLQQEKRTPTSMLNLMMADACKHSSHEAIVALGRGVARGVFIERAYKALFECLEFDSAEHCISLLLFAMVISHAGLHRAWIMQSLSTQMAIRLRFNTIDSPLSALAFKNDSELIREWKRRVFWQLYSFELLSNTLGDLPPCLSIDDVRCNTPRPLTEELTSSDDVPSQAIAALGPAVIFCEDQSTIGLQIELMGIMCDISSLQNRLTPEENLFPPDFMRIHSRLAEWQKRLPHLDVLVEGNLERVSAVFKSKPGLIVLGLLCQYVQIYLCLIKDTWLPTTRAMTPEETKTLEWTRNTAYEKSQVVHRLVPFVQGMRLNTVSPVVSNVVFQACIVSVHSCGWKRDPHRILTAVHNVQCGLEFLEYVSPRWGFASIMTTSLRSLIVERGFGAAETGRSGSPDDLSMEDDDIRERNPGHTVVGERVLYKEGLFLNNGEAMEPNPNDIDESNSSANRTSLPAALTQSFQEEANWERILRTGELPSLHFETSHMRGPCTRMEDVHLCASGGDGGENSTQQPSPDINSSSLMLDLVHDYLGKQ